MAKISMKVGNTQETANRTMKGIRREKTRKSEVKKAYLTAEERAEAEMEEAWRWSVGTNVPSNDPDSTWFITGGGFDRPQKYINIIEIAKQDTAFWEKCKKSLIDSYREMYPDLYKGKANKSKATKSVVDEYGKYYVFEPLYKQYTALGNPEGRAIDEVLKEAGINGFYELVERARMKCYDIDTMEKSKVKKSGLLMSRESLDTFKSLIEQIKRDGGDDSFGFDELYRIYEESVEGYNEMVEEDGGEPFIKSKTIKSARDPSVLLKKGWSLHKAEEEAQEEESEEDESPKEDADSDAGQSDKDEEVIEVDEDVEKAKKSAKKDPYKAMQELMKAKGWVFKAKDDEEEESEEKADDQGPDSEDVEDEALEEDAVVDVPDTPEPSDDVEDTATGMPEEPPLPESEDNDTPTEEDGNGMDALLPKTINNIDIDLDEADDDLDEMIDKKRMEKDNDISLSSIGGMQPFKNNYRTTQMGEGKMDALSQMQVKVGKK